MKLKETNFKTFRTTSLANGYYLATRKLTRIQCGGEQTWKEFKAGLYCERDPREMAVWCVCNGTAHLLNVNAFHLLKNAELSEMTPRVAAILEGKPTWQFLEECGL